MEIYLAKEKILQKLLGGGYFFDSHCMFIIMFTYLVPLTADCTV